MIRGGDLLERPELPLLNRLMKRSACANRDVGLLQLVKFLNQAVRPSDNLGPSPRPLQTNPLANRENKPMMRGQKYHPFRKRTNNKAILGLAEVLVKRR